MRIAELQGRLDDLLKPSLFKDYCPNGLQVEGCEHIGRLLCGVTASQALLDHAVVNGYDAVFVHHGYFWRGEDARITGMRKRRLATLLKHDLSLFAYHLPLDAHPELGNNAQLGRVLGWRGEGRFGENELGWLGTPERPCSASEMAARVAQALGREPQLVGDGTRIVRRVAWCSGAAQGYFEAAIAAGADLFLSGEISEPVFHQACELGVPYVAAGHHATERYGAEAVASYLSSTFGLEAVFVDIDNPV